MTTSFGISPLLSKYKKPGKGKVKAIFEIKPDELDKIQDKVNRLGKSIFDFETNIMDMNGEVVAEIKKRVYVRKK